MNCSSVQVVVVTPLLLTAGWVLPHFPEGFNQAEDRATCKPYKTKTVHFHLLIAVGYLILLLNSCFWFALHKWYFKTSSLNLKSDVISTYEHLLSPSAIDCGLLQQQLLCPRMDAFNSQLLGINMHLFCPVLQVWYLHTANAMNGTSGLSVQPVPEM